ncbi:MAG: hypothetical protein K2L88_04985, partial [Clostridiales bacterium]|nr:hypothetical protein [Clostridiales bacterium]
LKRAEMFDKGMSDGSSGSVDLTYIHIDDYVCGLTDGCAESDRGAVLRLFECNGVDVDDAVKNRRKFLAHAYVTVNSVLRSISVLDECEADIYTPIKHGERAKRYVKVFNILFPLLLVVYAVFTCIFASPKYVALFSVAALITYGVMRIPILLYSPSGGINIFAPIEKLIYAFVRRKNNTSFYDGDRRLLSETAYFGCEPQYLENVIDGKINVRCDNRGGITINSGKNIDALYLGIRSDELTASLSECDGAIERHRATYRVCKGDIELCAEVLAPIDISACIVKLTVVNRSDENKIVSIIGAVVRNAEGDCVTENICGGAFADCDDGFALSVAGGQYGGDLSAFCADKTLRHVNTGRPALIGVGYVNVKRFSRACSYVTVVYAQSRTEAESLLRYATDDLFYSRAAIGASVYCELNNSLKLSTAHNMTIEARENKLLAKYSPPSLAKRELSYILPFGGITEDNAFVIDSNTYRSIENTVANCKMSLALNQFGIQSIAVNGQSITKPRDMYLHAPRAFVVIGESGVIWSPTSSPCGEGEFYTVHNRGYTEYVCAYNGIECTQKCFAAKSVVFIEVELRNKTSEERSFDVMFSALCNSGTSVELTDNGVIADNLLFCAHGELAEYALYKESYYIYGRIARTSGFRAGGSTPAPTVSVRKTARPNAVAKAVFCITDSSCELPEFNTVNDLFDNIKRLNSRLGRIYPKTDDGVLNISYNQALYSAYTAFISRKNMSLFDTSLVMSAVKYADLNAVKNRIYEIFSEQSINGELHGYADSLQFLCCVTEYLQFVHDSDFVNDILPYAAVGRRAVVKETVYDHILRAVEYLIANPAPQTSGIVKSIWNNKNFINVLRFWQDRIKNDALAAACKKRFTAVAAQYSRQVKRLISNNFFEFGSLAEAYMCAKLLFDLDLNEKAYNIIKYNNPIERCLHYGNRAVGELDCLFDPIASAVYFTTVTERLFGVKFRGKTVKIYPHTSCVTPKTSFDICGKTKNIHITVDDTNTRCNLKMRVNRISYPADSVEISKLSDDIIFYRDGNA